MDPAKGKKKISLGWTNISTEEMAYIVDTVESGTNIDVSYVLTSDEAGGAVTMISNFVLEFLYTRFVVYRNSCDTIKQDEIIG